MFCSTNTWKSNKGVILIAGLLAWICFCAIPASGSDKNEELSKACRGRDVEKVKQLLDEGVDVNGRDQTGDTPLTNACNMDRPAIVELLLTRGADPNLKDSLGDPPLMVAIKGWRNMATIKLLLEKGADPNISGQVDDTPLIVAARWGNADLVKLLLSHGADVNKPGNLESTPLIVACTTRSTGRVPTVKALIEGGANTAAKSRFGHTALDAAKLNKNDELVKFLIEYGVKE